jgi:hypothetical protein
VSLTVSFAHNKSLTFDPLGKLICPTFSCINGRNGSSSAGLSDNINDLFQKLGLDMGIVTNLQKEDQYLNSFIVYLTDDKLPESQKEARRLLLEISDYVLFDGVLYHSRVAK